MPKHDKAIKGACPFVDREVHPNKQEDMKMKQKLRFALDIQCFADDSTPATPATPVVATPATPEVDYDRLADVVTKKTSGTENKFLQSYFKAQGLSPEQANEAMQQYKTAQSTKQQEAAQAQQKMVDENKALKEQIQNSQIDAKIAELSSTLGVQAEKLPFLNKMVDRSAAAKEDGTLDDEKIKTAIEEVLKAFPDFKGTTQAGGFQQIGGGAGNQQVTAIDDQLDAIFGVKKK